MQLLGSKKKSSCKKTILRFFVSPIKDVTAAAQGANSKWGSALASAVRSHSDLGFSRSLPRLSFTSLLCLPQDQHPPAPLNGGFLTGLSDSDATHWGWCVPGHTKASRHVMTPQPHVLNRNQRSPWCGNNKRIKKQDRVSGPLLLLWWWVLMCLCLSPEWVACPTSDCVCQSWLWHISIRWHHGGTRQSPNPTH